MKKIIPLICLCAIALSAQSQDWQRKVDPALLTQTAHGKAAEFIIVLTTQADLSAAKNLQTKEEKGTFAFRKLQQTALQTQKPIIQILQQQKAPVQSFFIVNAILSQGNQQLIKLLADHPAVAQLHFNPMVQMEYPFPDRSANEIQYRDGIEWGIQKIKADQVWALGYTGQGAVVGGQDTGYDWEHPAIKAKYRGWDGLSADHNYHWHDAIHKLNPLNGDTTNAALNPCGLDSAVPCDDDDHGTHTMGTMVGDDGMGNKIGVAPGARWIAVRNMERGWGSPATYIEGFQWFIAPTDLNDQNPDPNKAPHVINNSWGCPPIEGCNPFNFSLMNQVINNVKAAGIAVVTSAGNSGSGCNSINTPAAIFENSFAIGASRQNDTIAGFSSRGTVTVDSSNRLKPNVVAPGVGVRSSIRGNGYSSFSGTSMAGPHVAGLVALLISANPKLAGQVEQIEAIIEETATPMQSNQQCGDASGLNIPNAVYGFGRIDALAAVQRALQLSTDTEEASQKMAVAVFPNPTSGQLTFQIEGISGEAVLSVFNTAGQLLQHHTLEVQRVLLQPIDLQNLPAGIYLYRLKNGSAIASGRIVKN